MLPRATTGSRTQTTALQKRFSPVFRVLQSAVEDDAFPGAAVCVTCQGEIVLHAGVGHFTYEASSPAVTPQTIYDLASLTKVLAGVPMTMRLYERGALRLDQPVADVLPEFSQGGDPARRSTVTFAMLLAHCSGLPAYGKMYQSARDRGQVISAALRTPLETAPGTRSQYSDIGFIVLTAALEKLAGERIDVFCEREFYRPLGMMETRFRPSAGWQHLIPPSEDDREFRKRTIRGEVQDENAWVMEGVSAHAGLFAPAKDVARFAECMLLGGDGLFRPETVLLFTTRCAMPAGNTRALGWDTPSPQSSSGKYFSPASFGHLGFAGTSLWIDPEKQLTVTLLTNRCWPTRDNQKIRQVRPLLHDAVVESLGPVK